MNAETKIKVKLIKPIPAEYILYSMNFVQRFFFNSIEYQNILLKSQTNQYSSARIPTGIKFTINDCPKLLKTCRPISDQKSVQGKGTPYSKPTVCNLKKNINLVFEERTVCRV